MKPIFLLFLFLFFGGCTFTPSEFACSSSESKQSDKTCVDGIWVQKPRSELDFGLDPSSLADLSDDLGPLPDQAPALCGNGVVDTGEQCEANGSVTCMDRGFMGGELKCINCRFDESLCKALPTCGNGTLDEQELCDGTLFKNSATCQTNGYKIGTLSCSENCTLDTTTCCGDGVASATEQCDIKDFKEASCPDQGELLCSDQCQVNIGGCYACGDGNLDQGEVCDRDEFGAKTCASEVGRGSTGRLSCSGDCQTISTSDCKPIYVQVSSGFRHSCGLLSDDTINCWGNNKEVDETTVAGQIDVPAGTYKSVSAGGQHTCALKLNGEIECWGSNLDINGLSVGQATPPSGMFLDVKAGGFHTCALKMDHTIQCWGEPSDGVTTPFAGAVKSLQETAGHHHCAIKNDDMVTCWGFSAFGQTIPDPATPYIQANGGLAHTCGVEPNGRVRCWGESRDADFGQATPPTQIFTKVSAGTWHTCALRPDKSVKCWGGISNPSGKFESISSGGEHSCGLRANGKIFCWGRNDEGQLNVTPL